MALSKTKTDLVGSESGGTITWQSVTGGGTYPSSFTRRDVSAKVGISFVFRAKYGATAPTTRPKLELFVSPIDSDNLLDTEAYETVELPTANNVEKQITVPLRFAEDVMRVAWRVTNGATNATEFYVGIVETTI